jgi:hypothetical protein
MRRPDAQHCNLLGTIDFDAGPSQADSVSGKAQSSNDVPKLIRPSLPAVSACIKRGDEEGNEDDEGSAQWSARESGGHDKPVFGAH